MPFVTFLPSGKRVEVSSGTTLFAAATRAGLPVASSCDAEATCGKCNMQVLVGDAALSPREAIEIRLLAKEKKPAADRISCVTRVLGDCTVTTGYW